MCLSHEEDGQRLGWLHDGGDRKDGRRQGVRPSAEWPKLENLVHCGFDHHQDAQFTG